MIVMPALSKKKVGTAYNNLIFISIKRKKRKRRKRDILEKKEVFFLIY